MTSFFLITIPTFLKHLILQGLQYKFSPPLCQILSLTSRIIFILNSSKSELKKCPEHRRVNVFLACSYHKLEGTLQGNGRGEAVAHKQGSSYETDILLVHCWKKMDLAAMPLPSLLFGPALPLWAETISSVSSLVPYGTLSCTPLQYEYNWTQTSALPHLSLAALSLLIAPCLG